MVQLLTGVVYITGAGSGIGQATAYSLAKYGCRQFAITDLFGDRLKETTEGLKKIASDVEVLEIEMNTAKEEDVERSIDETVKKFGGLDYAVNNAGRGGPAKSTADMTKDDFTSLVDVNLTGVWMCERAQIRQMLKQDIKSEREGRGAIVNVASMLGTRSSAAVSNATDYTATKHGVMGLTKADAIWYGRPEYAIRINAMCPGYVGTPLLKKNAGQIAGEIQRVPMQRMCEPEEIGDAITFLLSPMASFVCGHGLLVDGGWTV